jgi:arabinan endo-1,5-alpha-L-arabinosidase
MPVTPTLKNNVPFLLCVWVALGLIFAAGKSLALDGDVSVHDPSTVIQCDGRYWVFATGRGISAHSSADGFTWQREPPVFSKIPDDVHAASPLNDGSGVWAPDIAYVNGQYLMYYAVSSWGSFVSAVGLITSPTLTPTDPRYHWTDRGVVVQSVLGEDLNAIDPGILHAPDGTLWLSYGSYHGDIRVVQLDPKTGQRLASNMKEYSVSRSSEASDIIAHDGWYYLFVNHGSCCQGKTSTYNIRVGRSRKVTGPYLDSYGVDMRQGGGTLFIGSANGQIGPGHFGLLITDGLERFSCHYESDAAHNGRSALDIKPLLWSAADWPIPGTNVSDGTYQVVSQRTGTVLQVAPNAAAGTDPSSTTPVRLGNYITTDNEKWMIAAVPGGFYKITLVAGGNALESAAGGLLVTAAPSDTDAQKWSLDQTADGSYRIVSKATGLALTAKVNSSGAESALTLVPYHGDDTQKWLLPPP